mgnify:CR=1 FL=1
MQALVNGISGIIPGGISVMDFAIISKTDQITAQKILNELVENDIGRKDRDVFNFSDGDRLKTAIHALQKGASIDEVAEKISWRDFEGLVAEILEKDDFATMRNFMLKKPRMEIDVVGIKRGIALLIDCKHWKRTSTSALQTVVNKQIERTKHYVASTEGAMAIPVIVTLYQDKVDFINKVPIIPIFQFTSFVEEFYGNVENMETIEKD